MALLFRVSAWGPCRPGGAGARALRDRPFTARVCSWLNWDEAFSFPYLGGLVCRVDRVAVPAADVWSGS